MFAVIHGSESLSADVPKEIMGPTFHTAWENVL